MTFTKASQTGLVENLVEQIQDSIISGKYRPGEKLPPSRELEQLFGASRGTLREAFRVLSHKGLIEVKAGAKGGVFAKEAQTEPMSESLWLLIRQRQISIDDLYGFREVVEAGLIRLVIKNADSRDIQELNELLAEITAQAAQGVPAFKNLLKVERRIRAVFVRVSGSKMYESVLNAIWRNMVSYAERYLPGDEGMPEESLKDWQVIINSIEKKDEGRAVARLQNHLRRFAVHYKRGFDRYHQQDNTTIPDNNAV